MHLRLIASAWRPDKPCVKTCYSTSKQAFFTTVQYGFVEVALYGET
jgi:hypothetical protein